VPYFFYKKLAEEKSGAHPQLLAFLLCLKSKTMSNASMEEGGGGGLWYGLLGNVVDPIMFQYWYVCVCVKREGREREKERERERERVCSCDVTHLFGNTQEGIAAHGPQHVHLHL
jgi:hypothetical protein